MKEQVLSYKPFLWVCVSRGEIQNTGEISSFYKCTYCRYFSSPFNLVKGSLKRGFDVIPHACCLHSLSELQVRKPFTVSE